MAWDVTLDELDKIVGLVVARGMIGGLNFPVKNLWARSWGCPMFSQTIGKKQVFWSSYQSSLRSEDDLAKESIVLPGS